MDNGAAYYLRYLNGDDGGLEEIIRIYKDGLILYLNSFSANIHVAEELAEDTFVKLAVRKPRFSGKASFKTWLYAIGRNTAIDSLRRRSFSSEVPLDMCPELTDEWADLEMQYIREERMRFLHKTMHCLKPEYRQILWLTYFEGFSNREAAVIMKKRIHTVETLLYRARRSLKTKLEQEGFIYENL